MMDAGNCTLDTLPGIRFGEREIPVQERRKEFAKQASKMAEDGKVAIR